MYPIVKSKKNFFIQEKTLWLPAFIGNLITVPAAIFLKNKKFISPNLISCLGGLFFFLSAITYFFFSNLSYICSLGFFISFLFDSTDGKLARLRGSNNKFGGILDAIIDLLCHSIGLAVVSFALTKRVENFFPLIILLPYIFFLTYTHARDIKIILNKKKIKFSKKVSKPNSWQKFCWKKGLSEFPYNDCETIYISILIISINMQNPIIFLLISVYLNLLLKIYLHINNRYL